MDIIKNSHTLCSIFKPKTLFNMKKIFSPSLLIVVVSLFILGGCAGTKTSKVDPYIGDWEYVAETPQGSMDVVMTINKGDAGYTGSLSSDMGSVDLNDLKIEDGKLSAKFYVESYELFMNGNFEGDKFTGSSTIDGMDMPIDATKKVTTE